MRNLTRTQQESTMPAPLSFHDPAPSSRRRRTRGALAAAALVIGGAATAAFGLAPDRGAAATAGRPTEGAVTELAYTLRFDGVGAEGVDNVWTGALREPARGEVRLLVEYRGADTRQAAPVWPVRAILFVAADDASRSFAADLEGTLNLTTGRLQLTGVVSEGWRRGDPVEQTALLDRSDFDGAGTARVGAVVAAR
jgi:hypothetical protein